MVQTVSIGEAEYLVHRIAIEMFKNMGYKGEPMPSFTSRYPNRLESCLAQPFGEYSGEEFYPGFLEKGLALFYFCIKNHPFENGNKRFAVAVFMYFLIKNDRWLEISPDDLYELAKIVAKHTLPPEEVIRSLKARLEEYLRDIALLDTTD